MATSNDQLSRLTEETIGGLKIQPVEDRDPYINMLIYGESGQGKTVLAGSSHMVPEMAPVLFIDVEGGTFSLRKFYPDCDVVRVKSFSEMQKVYDELRTKPGRYKTVVLDSLTEMQKFSMMEIMVDVVRKDADRDFDIPSVREWGKNIEQIRRLVRAFRDLPINTIFTCLGASEKDQKTGKTLWRPSLSGKLSSEVAAFVDFVGFLYWQIKDGERTQFLLTGHTDTHVAKDRSGQLPLVVEWPSMQVIYNQIFKTDTGA